MYRIVLNILFPLIFSGGIIFAGQHKVMPGANQTSEYLPALKEKSVGLVVNHTSLINNTHIVDSLLHLNINISRIFSPEHGFRGEADAGALIDNSKDPKTNITIASLYGSHKKPTQEDLKDIDILLFDLQDVGVRFFTYISTLYYVMEACAENDIPLIVLDRPNPNGDYIAGPVLDMELRSFVGIIPVPIVYGLTIGELALMINGEGWLKDGIECNLKVISLKNWNHSTEYKLPIKPSPNLPNHTSIRLYPSLCIFEGTNMSIGRGTYMPFQVIGYPDSIYGHFTFTPVSIKGMSSSPKHMNHTCFGEDLRENCTPNFTLSYFFKYYNKSKDKKAFLERPKWIELLIGDPKFINKVEVGMNASDIEESWNNDLEKYKRLRKQYLIYPDIHFKE